MAILAHGVVNQTKGSEPIIEQRANGTIVSYFDEFRQITDPVTHNITIEIRYQGQWYVAGIQANYATSIAAAAAGTYPLSTFE